MKIRNNKREYVILAIVSAFMFLPIIFSNSAYISRLISTIDKTTDIKIIIDEVEVNSFELDDVVPEFVYGHIIDIDKPWNRVLMNISKKYRPTNIRIHYCQGDTIVGKAEVFTKVDSNEEYVFRMKNVYYRGKETIGTFHLSPF